MKRTRAVALRAPIGACVLVSALMVGGAAAGLGAGRSDFSAKLRFGPGVSNHPVNVIPSQRVSVPKGWPLDPFGAITCLTCHNALPSLDGSGPSLLRTSGASARDSKAFCANCHDAAGSRGRSSMHWTAMGRAHVLPGADRANATAGRAGDALLDDESTRCLGCHDGVSARDSIHPSLPGGGGRSWQERQRNHPVGIRYPTGAPSRGKSNVAMRPAALLPAAIRLPGGRVSCVSCHDLYRHDQQWLTVPLEGSQLCFACHEMD